jgi:hypothetical protein
MKRSVLLLSLTVALAAAACDAPPNDKPETTETERASLTGQPTGKPVDNSPANPEAATLSTIQGKDPGPPRRLSSKEAVDFHAHLKALAEAPSTHSAH